MNPLEQAIKSAIRANDTVGDLFARVGTSVHPRGFVLSAYRTANRAMKTALTETTPIIGVADVMSELKRTIRRDADSLFEEAQALGNEEAARQLSFYGVRSAVTFDLDMQASRKAHVDAVIARIDAQAAAIAALMLSDYYEPDQITGTDERQGILRPADIAPQTASWAAAMLWAAFASTTRKADSMAGFTFGKQAVAALDNRTTDCCLRVHGQVQPMDKPFELTGTPRFADKMDWPGFHWYCRTSGVLYLPEFDDGLTAKMRDSADWFLAERADGRSPDRSPADAFG